MATSRWKTAKGLINDTAIELGLLRELDVRKAVDAVWGLLLGVAQVTDDLLRCPVPGIRPPRQRRVVPAADGLGELVRGALRARQAVGEPLPRVLLEGRHGDPPVRDELVEQARLPLVEALRVVRIGEPQVRVVDVVADLVEQRSEVCAERHDATLLRGPHPGLDRRGAARLGGVETVELAPAAMRARGHSRATTYAAARALRVRIERVGFPLYQAGYGHPAPLVVEGGQEPRQDREGIGEHPTQEAAVDAVVERAVTKAATRMPSLNTKRVSPHSVRHTTAVHLLRAGVDINKAKVGQVGLGAAGNAIGKMVMKLTGNPVLGTDLNEDAMTRFVRDGGVRSDLSQIMSECEIIIATTGVPNLIRPEMVCQGQVILALSNPNAEIDPEVALAHGAAFAADGKSVNNVLGFPGIFRGAVDSDAMRITDEMLIAAMEVLVRMTPAGELMPNPLDKKVHQEVARAVAETAMKQGIARAEYVSYVER